MVIAVSNLNAALSYEGEHGAARWEGYEVPASVRHGILHLEEPGGRGKEVPLELGTLPAVTDDAGVTGRLRNLGYDATAETTASALTHFQQRCELDPTGSVNDETRDRLELEHGC
jgi:hypothetical protein